MSILYDEGQEAIAEAARRACAGQTGTERLLVLLERTGACDTGFWELAAAQGWAGLAIAEEHGGSGLGLVEMGIVAQASGTATAGAPFLTPSSPASYSPAATASSVRRPRAMTRP